MGGGGGLRGRGWGGGGVGVVGGGGVVGARRRVFSVHLSLCGWGRAGGGESVCYLFPLSHSG